MFIWCPIFDKNIIDIAATYTSQSTDKLLSCYDCGLNSEADKAGTKNWLESMNSISMKPYKIITLLMNT